MASPTTSPAASVDIVKSMYEAFSRRDLDLILSRLAPDCVWVCPGEGLPNAGVYTGPAGAAEFFRKLVQSEEITRFEPREFFSRGDDVIALGVEEIRALATGRTASTNWAMLFRFQGGLVKHFEIYLDTAAYLRAHTA